MSKLYLYPHHLYPDYSYVYGLKLFLIVFTTLAMMLSCYNVYYYLIDECLNYIFKISAVVSGMLLRVL